ncbi:unnamed protein product [Rotaria socialis]|nr:unnamed protein product [Rotaria socialis]CAF3581869.1 unnamed protein product [Rotaria socialis]CAF3753201.1 unnamed protein product [Rotaria socialis]CAF4301216.1 unnamed protein product [Rotaria socialis]CAF4472006.1 unnamed protein product [Rotaria socialis]
MAGISSMPRSVKIALGVGGFFSVVVVACLGVGGSLFFQERYKVLHYAEDSCRVTSASYDASLRCTENSKAGARRGKCYAPVWHVEFGQNGTRKGTIHGYVERSLDHVIVASDKYKVGSSYPCWYNTKKWSELIWYKPTTFYPLILLIIGAVAVPFAIISFIILCRLRAQPDL